MRVMPPELVTVPLHALDASIRAAVVVGLRLGTHRDPWPPPAVLDQLYLPGRDGGMGLRLLEDLAPIAHVASVALARGDLTGIGCSPANSVHQLALPIL